MGLIKPDFSEVQDQLTPGEYKVRIVEAKLDSWPAKGDRAETPYIKWTLETFDEADPKNNGRRVFNNTPISGKGAFRLQQFYKAAMKQELGGDFDTEMLLGQSLGIVVIDGMDKQGNPTGYTEIKSVKPL